MVSLFNMFLHVHVLTRDEKEGRKKEASKVKPTTRQSNTAHSRQYITFPKKNKLPRVGHVHTYSPLLGGCYDYDNTINLL